MYFILVIIRRLRCLFWSVATWVESFWLLVFSREIWQHRRLRQGRSMTKGDDEKTERTVEGAQMKIQTSAANFYIARDQRTLTLPPFVDSFGLKSLQAKNRRIENHMWKPSLWQVFETMSRRFSGGGKVKQGFCSFSVTFFSLRCPFGKHFLLCSCRFSLQSLTTNTCFHFAKMLFNIQRGFQSQVFVLYLL